MNQEEMSPQGQLQAAQHLPADLMLVKMEGEHIMTMASARRVSLPQIIKEATDLLAACPAAASLAVYSKPIGLKPDRCRACGHERQRKGWEKFDPRCRECGGKSNANMVEGKMQYARGLSIRAMESLSNLVGYNRLHADVSRIDDSTWKVTAVFVDYARGVIRCDSDVVSQMAKGRGGTLYKMDDARFTDTTLKGAKSKTKRNVIKDALPFELKEAYETKARELAPKFLTPEKIEEIVSAFEDLGIFLGDLANLLGKAKGNWGAHEYETLRGTWVALDAGEMTVNELLEECRRPTSGSEGQTTESSQSSRTEPARSSAASQVEAELTGQSGPPPDESEAPPAESKRQRAPRQSKASAAGTAAGTPTGTAAAGAAAQPFAETPAATAAPRGPVGTVDAAAVAPAAPAAGPSANGGGGRKMSVDAIKQYARVRYEDGCDAFDLDKVARVATGQNNPMMFVDQILSRGNPNWANFVLETAGQAADDTELRSKLDEEPDEVEVIPDDAPAYISDPLPRPPTMTPTAEHMEKQILGYKQAKRIKDLIASHIQDKEGFTNDEQAYLVDYGWRRAWYLDNNRTPPREAFEAAG